ncbi:MAG: hypothetical protein QOK47_122, partial [Actinomycetota bacterium]|nr:hypothetical protein [Actinomycetota bacterium]
MLKTHRSALTALIAAVLLVGGLGAVPANAQKPEPVPPEQQPGPEADLSLDLSSLKDAPLVGDTVELSLDVANSGPEDADEVWVYGSLSDSFKVTSSDNDCSSDEWGGVSCSLGSFDSGDERSFDFEFERVKAREAWGYFSINASGPDPVYDNNYAELYIEPDTSNPADVSVDLDADDDKNAEVGDEFTYEIEVQNTGPEEAHNVVVTDSIPYGVDVQSFASDDSTDDCAMTESEPYGVEDGGPGSTGGGTTAPYVYRELRCSLGTLNPDERALITLEVERNDPYELWNSAWVSTSSYDDNYENDYAYVSTAADPSVTSDISTDIEGPSTTPLLGDSFDVNFTVGNSGPAPVGDASLGAFMPDGLVLDSVSSADDGVECSANQPYPTTAGGGSAEGDASTRPAEPEPEPATPPKSDGGRMANPDYAPIYYGGQGFNCAVGALAPGDSVDVVASLTRVKSREQWITASTWSSNVDPDYEDNYGEVQLAPDTSHPADVAVDISGPDDADIDEEVQFDIDVTNEGPMDARSVIVTDTLPYGLDYVSSTTSDDSDSCTVAEDPPIYYAETDAPKMAAPYYWGYRQIRCDLGTLNSGASESVEITTTRTSEFEMSNSAYVETASFDSNYDNDYDYSTLKGEPSGPCPLNAEGTKQADDISVINCPVEAGAGADSVLVSPTPSARSVKVGAGKGPDTLVVNVPSGSAKNRRMKVNSGPGQDNVTIVVAPGATNANVVVRTGKGRDLVTIDATRLAPGVKIVVIGGKGADVIQPSVGTSTVNATWLNGFMLWGGMGNDILTGAYADDQLHGGGGSDTLTGGGGADTIDGGSAKDVCSGGTGTDALKS